MASFTSLPTSLAALSPTFLDQYAILEEAGVGGSGFVLKAKRKSDGLVCAAKLIAKDRVGGRGLVKTPHWGNVPIGFELEDDGLLVIPAEAYCLRRLRHPHVVSFVDLFADDLFYYLIMEHHGDAWRCDPVPSSYLPSPPITPPAHFSTFPYDASASASSSSSRSPSESAMAARLTSGPPAPMMRRSSSDLFECVEKHRHFSEALARNIFFQLVATVYDLARVGILHRDLKDENCCITADGRVKLVDFGSCVLFDPSQPPPIQREQRFYGTCTYAAPEVLAGKAYSMLAAEVYSLGILLSVLLTGEHPFLSPTEAAAGNRLPVKVPLSPYAHELMTRCLDVDPEKRISLEELRRHPWVAGLHTLPHS
ncbi:hypothetical protein JCM6882_001588 [Rhodosporidiobolus microsporus]